MRSTSATVCVLGAGPHGLSAVLHLLAADPNLADDIVVLDPSGEWMSTWYEQFARLEIENLRSPGVHHPSPDVDALFAHTHEHGFASSGLPYNLPTTEAFNAFTRRLVAEQALDAPLPLRPNTVDYCGGALHIDAGEVEIRAERLVIASNPHRRTIPSWVWPLCGRTSMKIDHAADVDLRLLDGLSGEHVLVIGGGLTAAHLAVGAAKRGARVDMVTRRPLRTLPFDTEPGWLGPKCLDDYNATRDPRVRIALARQARNGGSIPPWMRSRLDGNGIELHEGADVREVVHDDGGCALVLRNGTSLRPDRMWLATGTTPDVAAMRCLESMLPDIAQVDGYPVTSDDLRMGYFPIHVMGRLATATLGPAAGNLWGARHAARRIARSITGTDVENLSTRAFSRGGRRRSA